MKKVILLLLCTVPFLTFAQSATEAEVEAVIVDIFDGMRDGDSARVAAHFVRDATMSSVFRNQDGKVERRGGSLQGWLNAIGTPREEVLDERIWDVKVNLDGELATAWCDYALYIGESYSHCGVDAFQLYHDGTRWKVFHVADTRRKECDIPDEVKNK